MNPSSVTTGQGSPYNTNYDYQGAYNNSVNGYNQAAGNTQAAQNNLSAYQKNMVDPSQMYGQDLTNAQNMYGFNPQDLLRANQSLANTQTVMANLPQAVQQQGAYYGTTAGSEANNYAQQEGNLQPVLAGQTNAVNAYQNILAATQQQANQQATLGYQGEQLNVQALQNLVANALGYQGQQQQQEGVAQTEQSGYGTYLNALKNAQAAQESASAQMQQANVATAAQNQQQNEAVWLQQYINALMNPNSAANTGQGTNAGTLSLPNGSLQGSGGLSSLQGSAGLQTIQNILNGQYAGAVPGSISGVMNGAGGGLQ